jgi:hypothetical protein
LVPHGLLSLCAVSCAMLCEHIFDRVVRCETSEAHILTPVGKCGALFVVEVIDAEVLRAHLDE